jgi:hypothetical protein
MTVHTICDRCGMEYTWAGVTVGQNIYCCAGCASGGPCTCPRPLDSTMVVSGGDAVVVGSDDVVIVER